MKKILFLLLCMTFSYANAELDSYDIKSGDTLIEILRQNNYGTTYRELRPYVNQIMQLNPAVFDAGDADRIYPQTRIILPLNPNKPIPEPVPDPEPLAVSEAVPESPPPEPEPLPEPVIGEVHTQKGTTDIQRNGELIRVEQWQSLFASDIVITNQATVAEVRLTDQTQFNLGPGSELNIQEYVYPDSELTVAQPAGSLVAIIRQGAIRTITGLLGKLKSNQYRIASVLSTTIGIRGTDFTVRACVEKESCGDLYGASVAVQDGVISFENTVAEIVLNQNEFAQVRSATDIPVAAAIPEGFFDLELNVSEITTERPFWKDTVDWLKALF